MRHTLKYISEFPGIENVFVENISTGLTSRMRTIYGIPRDKELLFVWNYGAENLVITIDSIYYKIIENGENDIIVINWKDVSEVKYYDRLNIINRNENALKSYHFFNSNDEVVGSVGRRRFGIVENTSDETIDKVEFYLSWIADNYDYLEAMEQIDSLGDEPEEDEDIDTYSNLIIRICDNYIQKNKAFQEGIFEKLAIALELKGEYVSAIHTINKIIENTKKDDPNLWENYCDIAFLYNRLDNPGKTLENFRTAHSVCNDSLGKIEIKKEIERLTYEFNETFFDLPYSQRKLIVVNDEYKQVSSDAFIVLDKNNLPATIKFPVGHPRKEELYVIHPFIKEIYLPYSSYETTIFRDKFEEMSVFIQCLGAKSMTIRVVKGEGSNSAKNSSLNISGSIGMGKSVIKNTLNGSIDNKNSVDVLNNAQTAYSRTQKWNPTKKPYMQSDMIWLSDEPSWQRLYQQRISGNILSHHDVLSSKSSYSISEKEEINLKVAFKNFFIDANVDVNELVNSTFSKSETIEWEIEIEFESLENIEINRLESLKLNKDSVVFNDNDTGTIAIKTLNTHKASNVTSDFEQEYLEEVKFMLDDDGIIDAKERSILERFRIKKGISENKAIELENILTSIGDLNENEKEYLEEFKELLNDGEIAEKERRILNRMAGRLGISEDRVKELEM